MWNPPAHIFLPHILDLFYLVPWLAHSNTLQVHLFSFIFPILILYFNSAFPILSSKVLHRTSPLLLRTCWHLTGSLPTLFCTTPSLPSSLTLHLMHYNPSMRSGTTMLFDIPRTTSYEVLCIRIIACTEIKNVLRVRCFGNKLGLKKTFRIMIVSWHLVQNFCFIATCDDFRSYTEFWVCF